MKYNHKPGVFYHQFTEGVPIIFVEKFEDFAKNLGTSLNELEQDSVSNSNSYFRTIGFKNSPLRFVVFEDRMLRTLFGGRKQSVIDSTLALYSGKQKYPKNEKRALQHALSLAIKENRKKAYTLLSKLYSETYKSSPKVKLKKKGI